MLRLHSNLLKRSMFTLIIQGPLADITYEIIDSALSESRIEKTVVSYWSTDSSRVQISDKILTVVSSDPYIKGTSGIVWNKFNLANQALTTISAFKEKITTPYVIKLRSNWPYLNFQKIIKSFLEEPEKILTSNLFFRPTEMHPFHCSDHLIVSTKEVIEKAYYNVYQRCINKDIERTYYASNYYNVSCSPAVEQIICDELLYAKNIIDRDDPSAIMKANFNIIIAEELTKGKSLPVSGNFSPIIINIEEI